MEAPPFLETASWIVTIFLCLWTGIALFATINPYYFWKVTQSWKARKEPPKAYFLFSRIASGVLALFGLLILLLPHLQ